MIDRNLTISRWYWTVACVRYFCMLSSCSSAMTFRASALASLRSSSACVPMTACEVRKSASRAVSDADLTCVLLENSLTASLTEPWPAPPDDGRGGRGWEEVKTLREGKEETIRAWEREAKCHRPVLCSRSFSSLSFESSAASWARDLSVLRILTWWEVR